MSRRKFFSGDTEAQAVLAASGHFGVDPEELAYSPVEKRHGFLRGRRRVVIAVDEAAPRRQDGAGSAPSGVEAAVPVMGTAPGEVGGQERGEPEDGEPGPEPPPGQAAVPAVPEAEVTAPAVLDRTAAAKALLEALDRLLDLVDLDVEPQVAWDGDVPVVDLTGPDRAWLLDDGGAVLLALEHLARRMLWRQGGPILGLRLDSEGYRGGREAELQARAQAAAERVLAGAEPVLLEPLDAAERRVVHLAVQEIEGVGSCSEGSGARKRVKIHGA